MAVAGSPSAEQIIFFALHGTLSPTDTHLLRHYALQLATARTVAMVVLVYRPEADAMEPLDADTAAVGAPVCAWGDGALRRGLPSLSAAITTHAGLRATKDANHRRYFYFHASLHLWNQSFGRTYPRLRYYWRVEPDVLFAGSWAWLTARVASSRADVLLPHLVRFDTPSGRAYPHWATNRPLLRRTPNASWVYGLVSVGRYSRRFLGALADRWWARGELGYEEILLPMACVQLGPERCVLGELRRLRTHGWREGSVADYFRFRPVWDCDDFLAAAARHSHELWHPVKQRECWASYLDACDADGCHQTPPPLRTHCRDAQGFQRGCELDAPSGRAKTLPFRALDGRLVPPQACTGPCQ